MTRHFYTDPLAAAWMAKHFGMRFHGWKWNNEEFHFDCTIDDEDEGQPRDADGARIYIDPDSEHLLNVELGDIVSMTTAMDRYAAVNVEELRQAFNETGGYQIIQRNGIPFMWPESEAS